MDRRYTDPILIAGDRARSLKRVSLEQRAAEARGGRFDEGWLQGLIFNNPGLLPILDIEPAFGPALPLAREVQTNAGPIDLLLVSPGGYLTIVETKLWRNPEARREVVVQILDYAKELATWDLEELVETVAKATDPKAGSTPRGLYEYVSANSEDTQEQEFLDAISANLRRGRVLLLIAGDGIREGVEAMTEYLARFPQLQFTLALVELLVYELESDLLVVPQVLARTREIVRAVVRDETSAGRVSVEFPPEEPSGGRYTLTEIDFRRKLAERSGEGATSVDTDSVVTGVLKFMHEVGLEASFRQASFTARLPGPGGSGQRFYLFRVTTDATIDFSWRLSEQLQEVGLPESLRDQYARKIADEFGVKFNRYGDAEPIGFERYLAQREAFEQIVRDLITEIQRTEPTQDSESTS